MMQLMWIGLGSGLGGAVRYLLDLLSFQLGGDAFPFSTLVINISGSLLIGWLAGRWATGGAIAPHPYKWHFWMTGVCGGYTTYSTFSWQLLDMIQNGQGQEAGLYAAGSVGFGLMAVWLGLSMAVKGRTTQKEETDA